MKIVVLEGSPNRKGSSNLLAAEFIHGAEDAGHSILTKKMYQPNFPVIRFCLLYLFITAKNIAKNKKCSIQIKNSILPNRKGSSNLLAAEFIHGAEDAGHSVTVVDAGHEDIHHLSKNFAIHL